MLTKPCRVFLLGRRRLCIASSVMVLCAGTVFAEAGQVPSRECGVLEMEKPVFRVNAPTFINK